jgi:arylformamidase
MKKIVDISWPISEKSTEYKNRKTIVFEQVKTIEKDNVRETILTFHAHSGTHIDLPSHMIEQKSSEIITLEKLVQVPTCILDFSHIEEKVTQTDLEQYDHLITKGVSILLKTRNSNLSFDAPFNSNFVYLASDAAAYLVTKEISLIGIDYLGIERNQPGHPTHKLLLQNNIVILEGLRLQGVTEGKYLLTCLPLSVSGIDALPARAILEPIV